MFTSAEALEADSLTFPLSRQEAHAIAARHGVSAEEINAALHGRNVDGTYGPSIHWVVTDAGTLLVCARSLLFWLGY